MALIRATSSDDLRPFVKGSRSPAELARETGQSIEQVLRQLKRWEKLGILEVKQVQKRAGRPVRHYGLTATSFYIPPQVLSLEEIATLVNQSLQEKSVNDLYAALRDYAGATGTQVSLTEQSWGAWLVRGKDQPLDTDSPDFPAVSNIWTELALDYADACALRDELGEVVQKYAGRKGAGTYTVHWLMTPTSER